MKRIKIRKRTKLQINESYQAISIEQKVKDITTKKEPIDATAPIIYTERKEGVMPAYDIRTDRWEIAQSAMDRVHAAMLAKRESKGEIGKPEPIATENNVA